MEKEGECCLGVIFCENGEERFMIWLWVVECDLSKHMVRTMDGFEESGMERRSENNAWNGFMIKLCVIKWEIDFFVNVEGVQIIILEGLNMFWVWRVISGDVEIERTRNDSSQSGVRMMNDCEMAITLIKHDENGVFRVEQELEVISHIISISININSSIIVWLVKFTQNVMGWKRFEGNVIDGCETLAILSHMMFINGWHLFSSGRHCSILL